VDRDRLGLFGRALVEEDRDVVTSANAAVVIAVRADIQIANELLANVGMPAASHFSQASPESRASSVRGARDFFSFFHHAIREM
jgi:hypothetical protein